MTWLVAKMLGAVVLAGWLALLLWWPRGFRPLAGWGARREKHTAPLWRLSRKGQ